MNYKPKYLCLILSIFIRIIVGEEVTTKVDNLSSLTDTKHSLKNSIDPKRLTKDTEEIKKESITEPTDPEPRANKDRSDSIDTKIIDSKSEKDNPIQETTKREITKEPTPDSNTGQTPTFDMKDFKVTPLKSSHFDEEEEDCLANIAPEKVEAVKRNLKRVRHVDFVTAEPNPVDGEEVRIAHCLLKEEKKKQDHTKYINDENKVATTPLDTVEEQDLVNKPGGRRDTEYAFDQLNYYDDDLVFDNSTCPNKVEVITLYQSEVKKYDLGCELITYWTGMADVDNYV